MKQSVSRADIEHKFREIQGELDEAALTARPAGIAIGASIAVGTVGLAYLLGQRKVAQTHNCGGDPPHMKFLFAFVGKRFMRNDRFAALTIVFALLRFLKKVLGAEPRTIYKHELKPGEVLVVSEPRQTK